jgi:hypothetical protein
MFTGYLKEKRHIKSRQIKEEVPEMEKNEMRKEIDFKMWRVKFWESFHIVPSAFDYINDFSPQEVKA